MPGLTVNLKPQHQGLIHPAPCHETLNRKAFHARLQYIISRAKPRSRKHLCAVALHDAQPLGELPQQLVQDLGFEAGVSGLECVRAVYGVITGPGLRFSAFGVQPRQVEF